MTEITTPTVATEHQQLRKILRLNIVRYLEKLGNISEDYDEIQLESAITKLTEYIDELRKLNIKVQLSLDDIALEMDINECDGYEEKLENCKLKILRLQRRRCETKPNETLREGNERKTSETLIRPKLPELKLSEFSGKLDEWQPFWEQFKIAIDNNARVSPIDKFIYLRNVLKGEALKTVIGIEISESNYERVKLILEQRFGKKDQIIQAHIDSIEKMKALKSTTPLELRNTYTEIRGRVDALESLGENLQGYGRILSTKVLRLFPKEMCLSWYTWCEDKNIERTELKKLLEFLDKEIEKCELFKSLNEEQESEVEQDRGHFTTESLHIQAKRKPRKKTMDPFCVFCEKRGHWGQNCQQITNPHERKEKLKQADRCFLCMAKGHKTKLCPKRQKLKCNKCNGSDHHNAICEKEEKAVVNAICARISSCSSKGIYLQTARVWVQGTNGLKKMVRCVFDTGSHRSFIDSDLVKELNLTYTGHEDLNLKTFESNPQKQHTRKRFQFTLESTVNKNAVRMEALESDNVYSSCPSVSTSHLKNYKEFQLADPEGDPQNLPIRILIGSDFYWSIMQGEVIRISENLVMMKSKFGWILNGGRPLTLCQEINNLHINIQSKTSTTNDILKKFWDLETIGIKESEKDVNIKQEEKRIMADFEESFRVEEDRAVVSLPWKENAHMLEDNFDVAKKRFESQQKRFKADDTYRRQYEESMANYYVRDQIEKLKDERESNGPIYYLPHQAVINQKRETTKVRIVFDASSHKKGLPSLNDVLHAGPNLNPETTALLLRFRSHEKVITADGTQAFLQLTLNEEDRDATRFLWYEMYKNSDGGLEKTEEEAVYRFKRLPFGLTCSPFLLAAAVRTYAKQREDSYPVAAKVLGTDLYVDDLVTGAEYDQDILKIYEEVEMLTTELQLPMAKWNTNSESVREKWKKVGIQTKDQTKILGVNWDISNDEIWFPIIEMLKEIEDMPHTKRTALVSVARIFDPLGLITPVSVVGKFLFQTTWIKNLEWDELLPSDLLQDWMKWMKSLPDLESIRIPRKLGTVPCEKQRKEIHVFCDASLKAYGAVAYIKLDDGEDSGTKLVMSKCRLAPVKQMTLPRLELLATLIGTRLLYYIQSEINLKFERSVLWSDSMIALGWIKGELSRRETFVVNRVSKILEVTTPEQWRHCPGKENPADLLTRGIQPSELKDNKTWWKGPSWLVKEENNWPDISSFNTGIQKNEIQLTETMSTNITSNHQTGGIECLIAPERVNNLVKLLRITAWVLRFIRRCKNKDRNYFEEANELTSRELQISREVWIKSQQSRYFSPEIQALKEHVELPSSSKLKSYKPFIDEEGFLRLGGRLQFSEVKDSEKHPIILEGKDFFTRLIIRSEHVRLFHMGVRMLLAELRSQFWILHGRQAIKQVVNKCIICRKFSCRSGQADEAPLPPDRIRMSPPFETTGVDFAGPLCAKRGTTVISMYIVLFTCAVTRALHLELTSDMSTEKFILALQRFFARRGISKVIYSDNAKTFQRADKEIQNIYKVVEQQQTTKFLSNQGVTWKYIPPKAPWWGGWWERMVQTVKRCLKLSLGKTLLDEEQLRTTLTEVEAVINSRPITYVYSESEEGEPLTPAHFLVGNRLTKLPNKTLHLEEKDLHTIWKQKQSILDSFWRRWQKEYLLDLRSFHQIKGGKLNPQYKVNDIVLLADERLPRQRWKMGRIIETNIGRDGQIRSCFIKTASGQRFKRPIQLLYPLEIGSSKFGQEGEC